MAGIHKHDALWHVALAEVAFQTMPPEHPLFARYKLTNYNYLFDFFLFGLNRIFHIPPVNGFFHVMPVIEVLLYIFAVWKVLTRLYATSKERLGVALFLFLGNSGAFLMTLFREGTLVGSATRGFPLVLSIQPLTMFYNHQYALSLSCILFTLFLLHSQKTSIIKRSLLLGLIFGLVLGLKVYAGIVMAIYIAVFFLAQLMQKKENIKNIAFQTMILGIVTLVILYGIYGFEVGGKTFVYDPLAFIRSIIDDPNHFFVRDIALARDFLEKGGRFSPRLIAIYGAGIGAFYLISFGARIISIGNLISIIKRKRMPSPHHMALWVSIIASSFVPLFFVQEGDWFNTMQFLYYGVFFSSFLAGEVLAQQTSWRGYALVGMISITLLIPYGDIFRYPFQKQDTMTTSFLSVMKNLRGLPSGAVIQIGFNPEDSRIPAFSAKPVFFSDEAILKNTKISSVDIAKRKITPSNLPYIVSDKSITYAVVDTTNVDIRVIEKSLIAHSFHKITQDGTFVLYRR